MSTRASIHFTNKHGKTVANIYRHGDGYPETETGVLAGLDRFFTAVEAQTADTRYGDASYLAAKFVVWQAGENARGRAFDYATGRQGEAKPLNFLSVGIQAQDPNDIEYVYKVQEASGPGRPQVTWHKVTS